MYEIASDKGNSRKALVNTPKLRFFVRRYPGSFNWENAEGGKPMLTIMPESKDAILAIKATGQLTDSDYKEVLIPKMEQIIERFAKARALMYLSEDFIGWEPHAMWDDAKFGLRHRNDFEKLAVVGGTKWMEWATKIAAHFMKGEVRTFSEDQMQQAVDWVES
jgi:hypothetical protein